MLQRYLTRCCFALLLGLICMANHGTTPGIADMTSEWDFTNWLNSPLQALIEQP
jgi:hypothetical protein